jgi:glycosyltransferase involved in cell wall biosynthesis
VNASTRPYLSVVVPAHNEAEVIVETHRRVTAVCAALNRSYEFVVVNDGSTDRTWEILGEISQRDANLVAVNLSRNHGHQLALTAGLHVARGDRVLVMDADLQDPPELLPDLLQAMDAGADVAYAQRRSRPGDSMPKRILCAVFYRLLAKLSDVPTQLDSGDFRLLSRRVVDLLRDMPERQPFLRGMVSWVGFQQVPVFYDRDARFAGTSKYPLSKLMKLAFDAVVSSSLKPLAFASVVGSVTALVGVALLAYAVVSWLFIGGTPHGWTSLLGAVVLLGSLQLFMLGIIGEYLGRIFVQTRGRPVFLVDRIVRNGRAESNTPMTGTVCSPVANS